MSARNSRTGLRDPAAFFETLRPARSACTSQLRNLRPFGAEYHMLCVIIAAMDVAAEFFTKQRSFYSVSSPDMIGDRVMRDART